MRNLTPRPPSRHGKGEQDGDPSKRVPLSASERGQGRGSHNIVVGQPVENVKIERARQLRREMTPEERILWERFRANRFHGLHFRRQQVIDGFIVDFYCHALHLVVEVDGEVHRERRDYDQERDRILSARGLRVLRVTNEEVKNGIETALARIADLTPQPPSRHGKGEEAEVPTKPIPLSVSERGKGRGSQ